MPEKNELQHEFTVEQGGEGEALPSPSPRPEPPVAHPPDESPTMTTERLMEEVLSPLNLDAAIERVQENEGAPGVDGMPVGALREYLGKHLRVISEQLLSGTYKPKPVKRVRIPKDAGGTRDLGIPTVVDRMIQQAILQVLQPRFDPTFSESSFGFRPGRSAHQAVLCAQEYIEQGNRWVVDIDLEKFFDRVNHDVLMGRLAKRIADKRLLKVIRAFLNAGIMDGGVVSASIEGTPQGGPLSPLLSNVLLDDLDRELERRGLPFARYADDCNIYVATERAGKRVKEGITRFLSKVLRLKVNESKSAVARPWERKFLGFSFTNQKGTVKTRVAPRAVEKLKEKIRKLTPRENHQAVQVLIAGLNQYLRGWIGYFGIADCRSIFRSLDGWIRRRLRATCWTRWKNFKRRLAELTKRGVAPIDARCAASSGRGPWRLSKTRALQVALPTEWFIRLGLPSLDQIAQARAV